MGGFEGQHTDVPMCAQLLPLCVLENLVNHVVAILLYSVILGTFQVRMWEACFPLDDTKY